MTILICSNDIEDYDEFEKECNAVGDVNLSKELNLELQSFNEWSRKMHPAFHWNDGNKVSC